MPQARFSMSSQGAAEYRALARSLRQAGRKDLRAKLRKKIVEAGKPVVDDVKSAVQGIAVTGSRGGGSSQRRKFLSAKRTISARRKTGLRRSIASATGLRITSRGVRIIVNSDRLPQDQRNLPRHLDSPKGWRHPVFGNWHNGRKPVHQRGQPYFAVTIKRHAPRFRRAILEAMDEIRQEIEK